MDSELPWHVRDHQLETRFADNSDGLVVHEFDDPDAPQSLPPRLECWTSANKPFGLGGQGQVFLQTRTCASSGTPTVRAVKAIPLGSGRVSKTHRYAQELVTNFRFSHRKYSKHFVKSLGWYLSQDSSRLCIAMEYLSQGDLQTYLDNQRSLVESECRMIVGQVVRGLQVMHREGFAHRDIKPANILIQQCPTGHPPGDWWVKLTDFGISKQLEAAATGKTTLCGTMDYMPPELLLYMMVIEKQPTPWRADYQAADVWAVGVMAFRTLTGSIPFSSSPDVLRYSKYPDDFPQTKLDDHNVSPDGLSFTRALLSPSTSERLTSPEALCHVWKTLTSIALLNPSHSTSTKTPLESTPGDERGMTTILSDMTVDRGRLSIGNRSRVFFPQAWIGTVEGAAASSNPQQQRTDPPPTEQGISTDGKNETESPLAVTYLPTRCPVRKCQDKSVPQWPIFADFMTLAAHLWQEHVGEEYRNNVLGTLSGPEGLLLWAANYGHEAVVRLLLRIGADLETRNLFGDTPLLIAANNGNLAIVSLLLETGADFDARNLYGLSPLGSAAYHGHEGIAYILLEKGANIEGQTLEGLTALHVAAQKGHESVVKLLLKNRPGIDARDHREFTPLVFAAYHGREGIAHILLEKGADIEAKTLEGFTALHFAAQQGRESVVKLLLKKKATLESRNNQGLTPLGIASHNGHKALVKLLLDSGAKIESVDILGYTPLFPAALKGHMEVVRLLLQRGANPRHENRRGKGAWEMPNSDNQELIALLKKAAGEEVS